MCAVLKKIKVSETESDSPSDEIALSNYQFTVEVGNWPSKLLLLMVMVVVMRM